MSTVRPRRNLPIFLAAELRADMGQEEECTRHLQTAVALRPGDGNTLYNAACTYGVLKRKTESLETLKRAVAAGYGNFDWMAKDPDLDCLHGEPDFQMLVGKA